MDFPSVSVIIPTADRSTVFESVASVLNQTYPALEINVVVDGAESAISSYLNNMSNKVRVFFTGGIGANGARMRGIAEARGDIVAFLDDDDVWFPQKLERQLKMWRTEANEQCYRVTSCRIAMIGRDGKVQRILPSHMPHPQERVSRYLFRRTRISTGEGLLHTSSLMCDRALVELEPWDSRLTRHQDWDWILRVGDRPDVKIHMCPEVLVGVAVADARSISMSSNWRASLEWLEQRRYQFTARERGDFLLCHTAPIAVRSGNRWGGLIAAAKALHLGWPGIVAWLVWVIHMISPRLVDSVSALNRRIASIFRSPQRRLKQDFAAMGLMSGQFYPGCEEPGIRNPQFRPLRSPFALLAMRRGKQRLPVSGRLDGADKRISEKVHSSNSSGPLW